MNHPPPGLKRVTEAYRGLRQSGWNLERFHRELSGVEAFAMAGLEHGLEAQILMSMETAEEEALLSRSVELCALLVADLQRMQAAAAEGDQATLEEAYREVSQAYYLAGRFERRTRQRHARTVLQQLNNEAGW